MAKVYQKTRARRAANVLALIAMIFGCILIIPMPWMIPMSLSIRHDIRDNKIVPTGLSVCYMIFGGPLALAAGICLLVDGSNQA